MLKEKIIDEDIENILNVDINWRLFWGKTILITGANGYVPAYFVHTFLALNDRFNSNIVVIALCRNEEKAIKKFDKYLKRRDFILIIQDVCEPIEIDHTIHYFIHAASPAGINSRYTDPVATFRANVMGADNLLKLALNNPCEKFLFISSVDVYGKMENNERLNENDCGILDGLNVRNIYSVAKKATEALCVAYYEKFKLPIVVVRPFQIFGPGIELNDGRLHIDFISQILNNGKIILKSDGRAKRTFLYITDAISAMLTVMLNGTIGECYNVVDECGEATVLDLANVMASIVTDKNVSVEFDYTKRKNIEVTSALSVVTGCSNKIKSLGWQPILTLSEGARRMMSYYGINTNDGGVKHV